MRTSFEYKKGTKAYDDICGIENKSGAKIVGGQEASPNQFPWLAGLEAPSWFCSSSIISEEWVLTAAHCVDGASSWDVILGSHNLDAFSEPHRIVASSANGILHPDWNPNTLANDIALIKLDSPIEFNDYIRPACLPAYSDASDNLVGESVTATGWGKLSDSSFSRAAKLHFAAGIPVMDNDICNSNYGIITDGHLCIDSTGGHGVCNGDSGGPLNLPLANDRYHTVGVASFVSSLGCESGLPHGFTRVTEYLQWIESVTNIQINP